MLTKNISSILTILEINLSLTLRLNISKESSSLELKVSNSAGQAVLVLIKIVSQRIKFQIFKVLQLNFFRYLLNLYAAIYLSTRSSEAEASEGFRVKKC